ncbi:hypothetical protein GGR56DRAFT_670393 [Xylariaceae sp. FL0804]|nr:hypothetical protein GGR56DRAFT_670393 [Xylariaceae sp. FL0804]
MPAKPDQRGANSASPFYHQDDTSPEIEAIELRGRDDEWPSGGRSRSPPPPPPYSVLGRGQGQRRRELLDAYLSWLALPLAVLLGGAVGAGSTYAIVRHVERLVATAEVDPSPQRWMDESRVRDYDPCYDGCADDCADPAFAHAACLRTAAAGAGAGIVCDGRAMWNWAERYPAACLRAGGEVYRAAALDVLRDKYRSELKVIILAVGAGLLVGWGVYYFWFKFTARLRARGAEPPVPAARASTWSGRGSLNNRRPRSPPPAPVPGARRKKFMTALVAFLAGRPVRGWPCVGYGAPRDVYFANANRTVFGRVRGWLSDCEETNICARYFGTATSTMYAAEEDDTENDESQFRPPACYTGVRASRLPSQYVDDVLPRIIEGCGFQLQPAAGAAALARVAHPGIERDWWVTISVSGYNVTDPDETDPDVWCLHDIGDQRY